MLDHVLGLAREYPWIIVSSALVILSNISYMAALRRDPPNPLPIILITAWVFLNSGTYHQFAPPELAFFADLQQWTIFTMLAVTLSKTWRLGWTVVRRRLRFNWIDQMIVAVVLCVFILWQMVGPKWANWIGQLAAVLAFIPFMKQAWVSTASMSPLPWIAGASCFAAQIMASRHAGLASLVFPLVSFGRYLPILLGLLVRRHIRVPNGSPHTAD